MKYRIEERIEKDGRSWFYPQRKWLFFWHDFGAFGGYRESFRTIERAKKVIELDQTCPRTKIHEIDSVEMDIAQLTNEEREKFKKYMESTKEELARMLVQVTRDIETAEDLFN